MKNNLQIENKKIKKKYIFLKVMSIIITVIVVLASSAIFYSSLKITDKIIKRRAVVVKHTPENIGLKSETISVKNIDGIELKAWHIPHKNPKALIVLLHGMDGIDASVMLGHSKFLYNAGYSTVAVDMRAHGRSEGDTMTLSYREPYDVAPFIDKLKEKSEYKDVPIVILGVSMGGATAIRTASIRQDISAVISVSAFSSIENMVEEYMKAEKFSPFLVSAAKPIVMLGCSYRFKMNAWKETPLKAIEKISSKPLLIAHGTKDNQVNVSHAYKLYEASNKKAELWIEEGAGHCVFKSDCRYSDDEFYRKRILEFLNKSVVNEKNNK